MHLVKESISNVFKFAAQSQKGGDSTREGEMLTGAEIVKLDFKTIDVVEESLKVAKRICQQVINCQTFLTVTF